MADTALTTANSDNSLSSDGVTLTQVHNLTINGSSHSISSDDVFRTTIRRRKSIYVQIGKFI